MTITNALMNRDDTLVIHDEGEWSSSATPYTAFNDAGVECETGEYLYSMVRILKPKRVLETGTHWGIATSYMGMAIRENNFRTQYRASIDTVEFQPENYQQAVERFKRAELDDVIHAHLGDVAKFVPEAPYQLILLDTEPQTRFAELEQFWPYLEEGGFVFIHDLHRHMHQIPNEEHGFAWPYGPVTDFMKRMTNEGKMRPFHFPTPRGLTGFYKVSERDYNWPNL